MGDSDENLIKAINHYQNGLERYMQRQDEAKMLHNMGRLYKLPIKVSHLEKTGVGRTVNSLRKLEGEVGDAAKSLVAKWKDMVMQEEDKKVAASSPGDEGEEENQSTSHKNERSDSRHNENSSSLKRHESSKSRNLNESDSKKRPQEGKKKKRKYSSSDESEDEDRNTNSDSDSSDHSDDKAKRRQKEKKLQKTESSNHKKDCSKKSKNSNENGSERDNTKHKKSDKHEKQESSEKKKHKHKSSHEEDKHKQREEKRQESSKEKVKSNKEKDSKEKKEHRHEKPKKSKHHDKGDKDSSTSTGHSSKPQKSSEEVINNKKKDHDSSKKSSKQVSNASVINGIGSESGTSFADALGMCAPPISKKRKTMPPPEKPRDPSPEPDENEPIELPMPKEPLENLDINISTLLPPITPNYRPLGLPIAEQPKKILSDDEALSRVMMNKNQRTKVFSGNKIVWGKVPSLFDICVRILQDNIDALEYTGGVPYSILKPILEKATANQLYMMEHHNPYLIEESDELWKLHCQKEFRNKSREELETWRDMYMRCLDEREAKLRALTANIKQSQDKSLPVRTTKLAYVDSVAKPPRNIARKQAKNATFSERPSPSAKLVTLATKGEAAKVAVPNPGGRAAERSSSGPSHSMKPKKAPLMAKTLSLFKNRFRR